MGQSLSEASGHVAQTASEQARAVVGETTRQARDLAGEAAGQARDQAAVQQQKAAYQLRTVADELEEMAVKGGQSGLATEVARQAAGRMHGAASWLEQREPADLVEAVRNFARRRPGTFLIGAAVAGLAAGRLTRGLTDAARSGDQPAQPEVRREIPPAAFTPSPADPSRLPPAPGYPAAPEYPATSVSDPVVDLVPAPGADDPLAGETAGTGYPTPLDYPSDYGAGRGVPGPGHQDTGYQDSGYQDSAGYQDKGSQREGYQGNGPESYRPGQP